MILAASLTPPGRGAVATVRIVGDLSRLFTSGSAVVLRTVHGPDVTVAFGPKLDADGVTDVAPRSLNEIGGSFEEVLLCQWGTGPAEDVVVCRPAADVLEVHCHGGTAAVARILGDLAAAGVTVVDGLELVEQTQGGFAAECAAALAKAPTERCAQVLHDQMAGTFEAGVRQLRADPQASSIERMLRWAEFGRHLTEPWSVVLTGRPNVGKSSLINRLLGHGRAIVSPIPGTTRDVVTGDTAFDGWPVRLSDTAGLRTTASPLEAAGIARARHSLAQADLRVVVVDVSEPLTPEDLEILTTWPEAVVVLNKTDLPAAWDVGRLLKPGWDVLTVSSQTGEGIERLIAALARRLVPELPPPRDAVPFTARQVACLQRARTALTDRGKGRAVEFLNQLYNVAGQPTDRSPQEKRPDRDFRVREPIEPPLPFE